MQRGLSVHSSECGVDVDLPGTTFVLIHGGQVQLMSYQSNTSSFNLALHKQVLHSCAQMCDGFLCTPGVIRES